MGFLFAALVRLLLRVIFRALAAACRAVHLEMRAAGERQRTHRDSTRIALWGFSQVAPGVWQDREEAMKPEVSLRLTHPEWQAVHRLQRMGLVVDQDEEKFIFNLGQGPFGAAAELPLTRCAFVRQIRRRLFLVGCSKRGQQLLKLVSFEPGRGQKFAWSGFELIIFQHVLSITIYSR